MADKLYRDREWLHQKYVVEKLSTTQISDICGCCADTIGRWMRRLGILTRPRGWYGASEEGKKYLSRLAKGRIFSKEVKRGMGAKVGHPVSKETRRRISKALKGRIIPEDQKQRMRDAWTEDRRREYSNRLTGRTLSRSHCQKLSDAWRRGFRRSNHSKLMTERWEEGCYNDIDFNHSSRPSSTELEVEKVLKELNFSYEMQFCPVGYHRSYDFYLSAFNVLIEVQGEYWHNEEYHLGITESDSNKRDWAVSHGFIPIEIWEGDMSKYGAKLLLVEELKSESLI